MTFDIFYGYLFWNTLYHIADIFSLWGLRANWSLKADNASVYRKCLSNWVILWNICSCNFWTKFQQKKTNIFILSGYLMYWFLTDTWFSKAYVYGQDLISWYFIALKIKYIFSFLLSAEFSPFCSLTSHFILEIIFSDFHHQFSSKHKYF